MSDATKRTRTEILAARTSPGGGCCDRYADNMACDCLAEAATDPPRSDLEAEIARLQKQIEGHCERIAQQSYLLSRKAEKQDARPAPFSRWLHPKTSGTYTVLCIAKCSTNGPAEDTEAVVYVSHATGRVSYRDLAEFTDGRFILLPSA